MIFAVGTSTHPVVFTSDQGGRPAPARGLGRGPHLRQRAREPGRGRVGGEGVPVAQGGRRREPGPRGVERSRELRPRRVRRGKRDGVPPHGDHLLRARLGDSARPHHGEVRPGRRPRMVRGTCNLKYGLSVGIEDDGIDCEYGWQGRAQFVVCLQKPSAGNNGWQIAEDDTQPRPPASHAPHALERHPPRRVRVGIAQRRGPAREAVGRRQLPQRHHPGLARGRREPRLERRPRRRGPHRVPREHDELLGHRRSSARTSSIRRSGTSPRRTISWATQRTSRTPTCVGSPRGSRLQETPRRSTRGSIPVSYVGAVPPEGEGYD